jgi:Gas vesicle synthesis protein GvpL/GvpF
MSQRVTYLYGITRSGTELPDEVPGIEDDAPIEVFDCDGLAAVISDVERAGFESDDPSDPEWVVPRALRHELVVETVLNRGPILPVCFGALFATRQALGSWIDANRGAISRFLDHVSDKQEWTIKMIVELGSALESLAARDPGWAARALGLSSSPGARYFQEKQLRAEAQRHVRQSALAAAERLRTELCGLADERLLAPRKPDRADVEHVLHSAYLVPRQSVAAFLEWVDQIEKTTACSRLEPSGPWPPSHFCPRLEDPHRGACPAAAGPV